MIPELALELRPIRPLRRKRAIVGRRSSIPPEYSSPFGEYQARRDVMQEHVQLQPSSVSIAIVTSRFIVSNYYS